MQIQKSFDREEGVLYVVATPIGNLQDMSDRAKECLKQVDCIAAEDTRQTRKLLSHFGLSTGMLSYHEHNRTERGTELIHRLQQGESIALVSDAGMPGISDPGEHLVQLAIEQGISVVPIPGPNAALSALVASGLPAQPFVFVGFLPRQSKRRKAELERWMNVPATLLFYESPHRIQAMLHDVQSFLGNRRVAIAREITKRHEEWLRGTVEECLRYWDEHSPRGEYTIVVEGTSVEETFSEEPPEWAHLSIVEHVDRYQNQGWSKKEAIKQVAIERSQPKREIYNHYHRDKE